MKILLSKLFYLLGFCMPNIVSSIDKKRAISIIEKAGYEFKPLWQSIPFLAPTKLDASFIIPVFNSEKYIRKCLESILNQSTEYNYEVICINDGSTDGTYEILKEYSAIYGERLLVINQSNRGISVSRNKGIEVARGKYIGFIDNDDYVAYDYVEQLLNRAYTTHADLVQTGIVEEDSRGCVLSRTNKNDQIILASDSIEDKLHVSGYIWCGIIRKSLFEKVRFPENFWYEDMITRMIILRICKKVAIIKKHLYYKLIHESNASQVLWKPGSVKSIDEYWLTRSLIDYSLEKLGCCMDEATYHELLYEFGTTLCVRTRKLGIALHRAVFSLASDYLRHLNYDYFYKDNLKLQINKSLLTGNYLSWLCFCLSYKFNPSWIQ